MSSVNRLKTLEAGQVSIKATDFASKVPLLGGVIGIISLVLAYVLGKDHLHDLHFSFHVAFLYFLSFALGGLFFVIIQHAALAGWSVVVRRFAEAVASSFPLFAILFISVLAGMHTLFHHWTDLEAVANDPFLRQKAPYLNEKFFYIRAVIYFVAWIAMGFFFYNNSVKQDKSGDHNLTRKMRKFSYPCIALFGLTLTFSVFDWVMSLDPHWYSTMFGVYFFAGSVIAIYAFLILVSSFFKGVGDYGRAFTVDHQHDLGKLMFGHTAFWAYVTFCQYFLIWYANIPEETLWYKHRYEHGWMTLGIVLMVGHFALPFWFMVSRTIKRNPLAIRFAALWMLVMHFFDVFYMVMPIGREHFGFTIVDALCVLGVGGLFVAWVFAMLKRNAIVPVKDPLLHESLAFENY